MESVERDNIFLTNEANARTKSSPVNIHLPFRTDFIIICG